MKASKFPTHPSKRHGLGSASLPSDHIETQKQRTIRGFEALQAEIERLRRSMSPKDWERFNQPLL